MMIHNKEIYTWKKVVLMALAVTGMLASCADNNDLIPDTASAGQQVGEADNGVDITAPIHLSTVSPVQASISTRAMDYDRQDGAFDKDTKLGIFIIHEYRARIKEMSTLSETKTGYQNLPMLVGDDGSLKLDTPLDTAWVTKYNPYHLDLKYENPSLYYPMHSTWERTDEDYKVTAIGYAPYKDTHKWDELDSKKTGFAFNVASDQVDEDSVFNSDLLIGLPLGDGLFRDTANAVPLEFKHALTKVNLELHLVVCDSTECDSMYIRMVNAPKRGVVKFSYDAEGARPAYTTGLNTKVTNSTGVIKIAAVEKPLDYETNKVINETTGEEEVVFHFSGIIIPSQINTTKPLQFAVILKNRKVEYINPVFIGESRRTAAYEPGTVVNYRMTLRGSEQYSIYVPEESEDGWIVGKPVE